MKNLLILLVLWSVGINSIFAQEENSYDTTMLIFYDEEFTEMSENIVSDLESYRNKTYPKLFISLLEEQTDALEFSRMICVESIFKDFVPYSSKSIEIVEQSDSLNAYFLRYQTELMMLLRYATNEEQLQAVFQSWVISEEIERNNTQELITSNDVKRILLKYSLMSLE